MIEGVSNLKDFKLIILVGSLYKVLSKVLERRLGKVGR